MDEDQRKLAVARMEHRNAWKDAALAALEANGDNAGDPAEVASECFDLADAFVLEMSRRLAGDA